MVVNLLLEQGWPTGGPRAACGPPRGHMRPADHFEKKEKKERSGNIFFWLVTNEAPWVKTLSFMFKK